MTFTYPSSWRRDTSQEFQKYLTVTSTTPNLNQQSTIGAVSVNSVGKNPKRLDPTTWFNVELSQNVESFTRVGLGKVRSYTTYTIIASELQSMRHIYIFSGTKVIEVSYPNDQIQFTSTYNDIVNSIQIR